MADSPTIAVLCGGVGAARLLSGLVQVVPPRNITAIVNVADDFELHGLHISPDLDTITYTVAGAIDPDRGWGLAGETWRAMEALSRYGDGDWFSLGDADLGTHLHRTTRLNEGLTLTEVATEIASGWELDLRIIPVTDDRVSTHVTLAESGEEVGFQRYFVGESHSVPISGVRFDGIESARATSAARNALREADVVVVAPSNPIVSISPVLEVPGVREALAERSATTVAVSPLVGGRAIKGPAAAMMSELGHRADAVGVASLWSDFIDVLVIDDEDAALALPVAEQGCTPVVTNTIMSSPAAAAALSRVCVSAGELGLGGGKHDGR